MSRSRLSPTRIRVNPIGLCLFVFWVLALVFSAIVGSFSERADIAIIGVMICLVITCPILRVGYDWISPWSMITLAFYIGCGFRGLMILGLGLGDPEVERLYLRGREVGEFYGPGLVFLLGAVLLTAGWMLGSGGRREEDSPDERATSTLRPYRFGPYVWIVIVAFAGIGLAGFFGYATATGGLDLTSLSAKRTGFYVDSRGVYEGGAGEWQSVNDLATVAFWLAVAKLASASRRARVPEQLVLVVLFLNASILPVYASIRSEVVYVLLVALVIHVCLRGRIEPRLVALVGGVVIVLLGTLTLLRGQTRDGSTEFRLGEMLGGVAEAMLLSVNFTEVSKAVHIILAVPETLPYSYGGSMANYLVAWVPRSIWPEKPIIDAGVEVGVLVYGTDGSAIPPGAIAEFYWMGGLATLIIGCLFFGWILGRVYSWARGRSGSVRGALLYACMIFEVGGNAVSGSVGYAVFASVMSGALMVLALLFAGLGGQVGTGRQRLGVSKKVAFTGPRS